MKSVAISWLDNLKTPHEILNSNQAKEVANPLSADIKPSDLATHAREIARSKRLQSLPVTENGKLQGILRSKDLLKITSSHSNIKASGLMTSPILTATPDWSLKKVAKKIIEFDLPLVPVVENQKDKKLLGTVSLDDILNRIIDACGETPKVEEIMTPDVFKINPEERISKVWKIMEDENITGIPVVGEKNRPLAMITRMDILQSGKARLSLESKKGRNPPKVKTIMKTPVITISNDAPIKEAAKVMKNHE